MPASQTRGGILLAWNSSSVSCTSVVIRDYSIKVNVVLPSGGSSWLTVIYGPQEKATKDAFLLELRLIRSSITGPWMVLGDFNHILQARDKNNALINSYRMGKFRCLVDDLELAEVHLNGRVFTWSNAREHPTLVKMDRVFASADWLLLYPACFLRPLPSKASDHCPMLLSTVYRFEPKKSFRFESFWSKIEGFSNVVQAAWQCPQNINDPFRRIDWLLKNTARALQRWSQCQLGNICQQIKWAKELLWLFDVAKESRVLASMECWFRAALKKRLLGLCSFQRTIARQRSRVHSLREGDASTHLFSPPRKQPQEA